MKRILCLIASVCMALMVSASAFAREVEVSVLTCSPGQEVYSLYGHTAIRVRDNATGQDMVFNYGVFDFNTEYFVWKFVLGETDYICASVPWVYFLREYEVRGSGVVEQVLNLTESEAKKVKEYLYRNVRPENRVYRYNFLKNNCTTKVMDCVEACVEGELVYSWAQEPYTYRRILRQYTQDYPWVQDGNDLLLGADVDTVLSHRATCFIPEYYMNALDEAVVRNEFEDTRKLVTRTSVLLEPVTPIHMESDTVLSRPIRRIVSSPTILCWSLFAVAMLIMLLEYLLRKMFWPLDVLLMLAHGLAGCLITFVFFLSEHPSLDSNWLIAVLNPLPLIALPYVVKAAWMDRLNLWHHFMAAWLALFLLFMPWMPQQMPALIVPVMAILLSRQLSYILHYGRTSSPKTGKKRNKVSKKKK